MKVLGSTIRLQSASSNVTSSEHSLKTIHFIFTTHVFKAWDGKSENIIKMEIKMWFGGVGWLYVNQDGTSKVMYLKWSQGVVSQQGHCCMDIIYNNIFMG